MALALGWSIRQVEALDATELDEWAAYYSVEPWGEERADLRNGILCALLHNQQLTKKNRNKAKKATDFMPFHEKQEGQSPSELRKFFGDLKRKAELRKQGT